MSIQKNYDIFDLVKFILSIFIISLHSEIVPDILIPVVRTAVPLFFMISSYLLFNKKKNMTETQSGGHIRRFISRNLNLYFFWTAALFPLTCVNNIYKYTTLETRYSALKIIAKGLQKLMFGAFPASWYIIASLIAALVLYWIPQKYNKLMLIFSFALYLICCTSSNYYYLFGADSAIIKFDNIFTPIFNVPHLSFLVAFIWMGIGKVCAESKMVITSAARRIGIVVSAIMLYLEHFAIKIFALSNENDCYIMLIPLCFFIFTELETADNFKIKNSVTLRKISTIIYCSHKSLIKICSLLLKYTVHYQSNITIFALTVLACTIECCMIFKLENKKWFTWLKYSH